MAEVLIIEHEERSSDASNDVGMEYQAEKQGNALQWLSENRQLNDLQLFAHVSAEVQLSLAVALRTDRIGFPEGSNALGKHHGRRPAKEIDIGHVEVRTRLTLIFYNRNLICKRGYSHMCLHFISCWHTT